MRCSWLTRGAAAAWTEGLSAELQSGSTAVLAVVEHVAATLPGGFAGYKPRSALPAALTDGKPWTVVTEEDGVKARAQRPRQQGAPPVEQPSLGVPAAVRRAEAR